MRCDKVVLFGAGMTGVLLTVGLAGWPMAAASAEPTAAAASGTQSAVTKPAHRRTHESHPKIHKALKQLEAAKDDLQHAAHDFGGHRVKAIAAIDQAIQELHLALQFDNT